MEIIRKIYSHTVKFIIKKWIQATKGTIGYARYLGVTIGKGCRIYINKFGSEPFLITIGNRVTITDGVKLLTHNGSSWLIRDEKGRRYDYRRIVIGDDVFIGTNSIIMPGVVIEDKVIIGAGSVVTKSIKSGSIVGGNPAKVIGDYQTYESNLLKNYPSEKDMDQSAFMKNVLSNMNPERKKFMHD